MTELLTEMLALPTVVFTMLLGVVAAYWLFVIAGALELDVLEGLHGAGESADAAVGAGIEAAHAHAHLLEGADLTVFDALGIRGVPLTVWLSGFILFAWAGTLLGMHAFGASLAAFVGPFAAGALIALAAMVVSIAATAIVVRPLRRFSVVHGAVANRSLVGKLCTVTTMRVDRDFGQAEIEDGGAGLLVQVRCAEANDLTRGSKALVFDYDSEAGVFHVARFDDTVDVRSIERRLRTPQ